MDENNEIIEKIVPESPRPLAFTVDFSDGKQIDTQRHKSLVEKFQKKHRRGQSLSKIDEPPPININNSSSSNNNNANKKHPSTGNLPRKSNYQSDGYLSSDEKTSTNNSNKIVKNTKRSDLSLTLKNTFSDKMSQSFPNAGSCLFNLETPVIELKDVSSPELDLISPFSPKEDQQQQLTTNNELPISNFNKLLPLKQQSSPINNGNCTNNKRIDDEQFIDGTEFDFDKKSDTVSDAGTYTLDADNYSEEQKARMSIDAEFKIEQVSVMKKTEEYIKSLYSFKEDDEMEKNEKKIDQTTTKTTTTLKQQKTNNKLLSPILSPTQNLSITETLDNKQNNNEDDLNKTFTRIIFPSPRSKNNGLDQLVDQGSVISVTSSGAFRVKNPDKKDIVDANERKKSLTQSEIHVEAYIGEQSEINQQLIKNRKLTTNIINVQSISIKHSSDSDENNLNKITNLPPNGKLSSPTKIPSPIHTVHTRPRIDIDLSDSSLETESYLKSTQNCINTLKQRLSLDDSDDHIDDDDSNDNKKLNNLLNKQKAAHIRHNSLDDKISNKLEHFHLKNLQTIDQTTNMFNQYNQQQQFVHKIQNSPNNSPIRRSSSFSTKNLGTKNTNVTTGQLQQQQQQLQKETNLKNSPNLSRTTSTSIQRSASTANIKPNYLLRRSSINSDHQLQHHSRIDRNQFGDTDTSSEEDFDKQLTKKKDLSLLTNTRYNRAFSLRRGRLDDSTGSGATIPKCPNTPEMRRKFPTEIRSDRAISVDRKPTKTNEVQSRYLLNITKKPTTPSPIKNDLTTKSVPKLTTSTPAGNNSGNLTKTTPKVQVFSRTDSGRFSTRSGKPPSGSGTSSKNTKKDQVKKSNGRSNSSLSCREKEFQNWKRRKSYDPMKAAAEGKRKELAKKQNNHLMTQSYNAEANQNQDCDSSPSHSSSVHRSQSFHGTAALEQLISSEEEEDLTLSADEGFSPPTPSPCELSPARASLRNAWKDHILR